MQFSSNAAKSQDLEAMTVQDFKQILSTNPGHVVLKLGAEWCGPCKKIEPLITQWFNHCPDSVACYKIDIDESFELYATFKTKRQVNGIPALLCFRKGNLDVIPDFTVTGADTTQVNQFFQQIMTDTK